MVKKTESTYWEIEGQKVPVQIHREARRDARLSFGKKTIIVRFPLRIAAAEEQKVKLHFRDKLLEWLQKKPQSFDKYAHKNYQSGDRLRVGNKSYLLEIMIVADKKGHTGKINKSGVITLEMNGGVSEEARQKAMPTILSRLVSWDFKPEITRRVNELNHLYFRKGVKSVSFKYNHSNWGSCSASGNLNFSSRLLFAPDDVVDYVIIHELAHLVELNHSDRFWKLVSDAMPDYGVKEGWLKEHGHLCRF